MSFSPTIPAAGANPGALPFYFPYWNGRQMMPAPLGIQAVLATGFENVSAKLLARPLVLEKDLLARSKKMVALDGFDFEPRYPRLARARKKMVKAIDEPHGQNALPTLTLTRPAPHQVALAFQILHDRYSRNGRGPYFVARNIGQGDVVFFPKVHQDLNSPAIQRLLANVQKRTDAVRAQKATHGFVALGEALDAELGVLKERSSPPALAVFSGGKAQRRDYGLSALFEIRDPDFLTLLLRAQVPQEFNAVQLALKNPELRKRFLITLFAKWDIITAVDVGDERYVLLYEIAELLGMEAGQVEGLRQVVAQDQDVDERLAFKLTQVIPVELSSLFVLMRRNPTKFTLEEFLHRAKELPVKTFLVEELP